MKNKNFLIVFFIIIISLFLWRANEFDKSQKITQQDHSFFDSRVGDNNLRVELVSTPESIKLGLGKRDKIGSDGMLFVFPSRKIVFFWMKEMRFNIDIIWIDGDKVIGISKNIPHPAPDSLQQELELYSPQSPVDKVLEVKAGESNRLGIKPGDNFVLN